MSDPFFVTPSVNKKRPGTNNSNNNKNKKRPAAPKNKQPLPQVNKLSKKSSALDEDLSDDSEVEHKVSSDSEPESDHETAEEKRLRLAKQYIQSLKDGLPDDELEVDAKDIDDDIIASRLEKDALESVNQLYYKLTDQFPPSTELETQFKKVHQSACTAVVIDAQGGFIYTGSKDASIVQWNLSTLQKCHTFPGGRKGVTKFPGHTGHILSLALSHDGKLLASGGSDKLINVWDLTTLSLKGSLKHHKDSVSGLVFREKTYDLYSCSFDRTVKVWNLEAMAYVETLFGHQDMIYDISSLAKEHCVTVGGRDRTLRLWRIVEQTQLVFRGGNTTRYTDKLSQKDSEPIQFVEGSLDKLAMLDEANFVTGGDSGSLCLWHTSKKKPTHTFPVAHGLSPINQQPYGISALAAVPYTDLVISGSSDGFLRLWKTGLGSKRTLTPLMTFPMLGFINSIAISTKDPKHHQASSKEHKPVYHIIAGLGQESAYGRWERIPEARNQIAVVNVSLKSIPKTL